MASNWTDGREFSSRSDSLTLTANSSTHTYASTVAAKAAPYRYSTREQLKRENTVQFRIQDSPNTKEGYLAIVNECSKNYDISTIKCIQDYGAGRFQVTFISNELAEKAELQGFKYRNNIFDVTHVKKTNTNILIKNAPYELSNELIKKILTPYGQVISIDYEYLDGPYKDISTGNRKVTMMMTKAVPNVIKIDNYTIILSYYGVEKQCHRCGSYDHLMNKCDLRPTCQTCGNKGHKQENCKLCPNCKIWNCNSCQCEDENELSEGNVTNGKQSNADTETDKGDKSDRENEEYPFRKSTRTVRSPKVKSDKIILAIQSTRSNKQKDDNEGDSPTAEGSITNISKPAKGKTKTQNK